MIRFEGVSKSIGGLPVLKDITFEIKDHETVSVLGPSGSGWNVQHASRLPPGTLRAEM